MTMQWQRSLVLEVESRVDKGTTRHSSVGLTCYVSEQDPPSDDPESGTRLDVGFREDSATPVPASQMPE